MNKRTIIESAKTLLIILLTASALLLIRSSDSFSVLSQKLQMNIAQDQTDGALPGTSVEMGSTVPAGMAVLLGGGEKYTAAYDGEALEECYHRFSALFGEALGSAGTAKEITQSQWRAALSEQGVFISYRSAQRPDVLAAWLGTTASAEISEVLGDMFIISGGEGENALLYYADTDGGKFYCCETAVTTNTLVNAASEFQPGGGAFAYETEGLESVFPYTIIPAQTPAVSELAVSNPLGVTIEMSALYRAFDLNSGALHQYEESDGTKVLVEGTKTLRVSPGGGITFSGEEGRGGAVSSIEALSSAYAAVSTVILPYCGEGELVLRAVEKQGADHIITFDYSVNGIAVELPGGEYAAKFTVGAAGIEEAVLNLRCYSYTGAEEYLLPVSQACAVASSEGAEYIELVYRENGGEVHAAWVMEAA